MEETGNRPPRPLVVVADRHPVFLRSLKNLLEPESEVVAMADNVLSLIEAVKAQRPPLVVLGTSMTSEGSSSIVRHLAARHPELELIVIGTEADAVVAREVLAAGCAGYVVAASAYEDLPQAIRDALAGRTFTSLEIGGQG